MTASRLVKKIRPFLKIQRNNVEEKRKTVRGNKVKEKRNRKCKQPHYYRSTSLENAEKEVGNSRYKQETSEDSENECCECWKNYMQITKEYGWIECVSCRN
jgi:hypothetical protein